MKQALSYMFKDNKFSKKYLVLLIFLILYFLCAQHLQIIMNPFFQNVLPNNLFFHGNIYTNVISVLVVLVSLLCMAGYFISNIKYLIDTKENYVLPNMNFFKNLKGGFKYIISSLVLFLYISILFIFASLGMYITTILVNNLKLTLLMFLMPIIGILFILLSLGVYYLVPAFIWIFANKNSWKSFFRLKTAIKLIGTGKKQYFLSVCKMVLIVLLPIIILGIYNAIVFKQLTTSNLENYLYTNLVENIILAVIASYTFFAQTYIGAKCINSENIDLL